MATKWNSVSVAVLFTICSSTTLAAVYQDINELPATTYDFIVVGGGTAGAVVASRLTENPKFEVLLVEAGPTNEGVLNAMVPTFFGKLEQTIYDWNFTTTPGVGVNNRAFAYPRGHILGGCSSHNAMFYTRGSKDDYDRWARVTGDPGWSWNNILPYILKNEKWTPPVDKHDTQGEFDPSVHGFDGKMFTSLPGFAQPINPMVRKVAEELPKDFPYLLDMNGGKPLGLGWFQGSIGNGTRSSSATAYLQSSSAPHRSNLHILLNTRVSRVLAQGNFKPNFNSIEISGSSTKLIAKKEIVLSAGPINTPHILLNSGVGDRNSLSKLNIPTVLHLPSVGRNLSEQPLFATSFSVRSNNPLLDASINTTLMDMFLTEWEFNRTGPYVDPTGNFIAWSRLAADSPTIKKHGDPSAGPNTPHMENVPAEGFPYFATPPSGHFVSIVTVLTTPTSRGSITLNETAPLGSPVIDLGFFTSDFDLPAAVEGFKIAQRFYEAPVWKDFLISRVLPPANTTSDADIAKYIQNFTSITSHAVGTASMSAENAHYGVVNPYLRVKGASVLRIVDASVMPFINSAHTQAPTYATAERASDLIKAAWN